MTAQDDRITLSTLKPAEGSTHRHRLRTLQKCLESRH